MPITALNKFHTLHAEKTGAQTAFPYLGVI